jgi:hypothetical protein
MTITYKINQTNKISAFTKPNHNMKKMRIIFTKSLQNRLKKINARELPRALENQDKDQQ